MSNIIKIRGMHKANAYSTKEFHRIASAAYKLPRRDIRRNPKERDS
jgi:hypothetical protein